VLIFLETRYSLPEFVAELHHGANILLAHWHYYRRDVDPLSVQGGTRSSTILSALTPEQFNFMIKICKHMEKIGKIRNSCNKNTSDIYLKLPILLS
jgi:hypothetical protein